LDLNVTNNGVSTGSTITASNAVPAIFDASMETTYVKMRRFVFGFQGGFDGQSPAIPINVGGDIIPGNTQGLDCTNINSAGSVAYKQAIAALGNADEFDINMIVTPGILYDAHSYVTTLVVEMCEARGDCFYILDLYTDDGNPSSGQINSVVDLAADFDTNYAGAYYPWVKIKDENTNDIITVPPSVVLPAVYAANDKVAGEWWAVAGLSRGGITRAIQVTDRTTHTERDTLYEGKVNPIAAFPGQGIVVWGQKTLQNQDSALNRINVRRLLIEIKKFFASTARFLVFEQNTSATRNRFLSVVNPFLQSIQQRSGLYAFNVIMDDSNNTPDIIDQNVLYGQIYLQPTKTAEFILFDFNILPTGAKFGPNA
jgi:phage tail sheath protein FI